MSVTYLYDSEIAIVWVPLDGRMERAYERHLLMVGWASPPDLLGRAEIRVARTPGASFLRFSVWQATGWAPLLTIPTEDWWDQVPGSKREAGDKHIQMTNKCFDILNDAISEISRESRLAW